MIRYPRVIVIANNSFSLTSSNGRALGNLFIGWPKDNLAEFCISTDGPNYNLCDNYYCITDYSALKSCFTFREAKPVNLEELVDIRKNNVGASGKVKKTALKVIIRNLAWMSGMWKGENFKLWVKSFKPDLVLIQNTDSAFMLKIGYDIAQMEGVPLVFYNTEGHYFFKTSYTFGGFFDKYIYKAYRWLYTRIFRKIFSSSKLVVHCNNLLKKDFDAEFSVPSEVIYISSFLRESNHVFNNTAPVFSYLGDFLNGRTPVLIELANTLHDINPNYQLDVYGNGTPDDIASFQSCPHINYKGFVSYEEVVKVMDQSDILFHVESQEKKWYEPLQYGFSAKIADTITMAKPFVQYSFLHNAGAQYLKDTKAGWFVENQVELKSTIESIISNPDIREERRKNALAIAKINHNAIVSREKFRYLLDSVVYDK